MRCNGFQHDTWTTIYNANFRYNGTNLYEWFIQYQRSSLPVVLKSFNARLQQGKVLIDWVTSTEVDASNFIIEKAGPDQQFSELATIKASGNTAADKAYSFADDRPLAGLSYYRLVQTDIDGGKHYFRTAKILNRSGKQVIIAAPNPFSNELSVYLKLSKRQKVTIVIADANGRIVQSMSRIYNEDHTELPVNTTHLSKGIYFLRAKGEGFSETHKLIRQ